MMAMDTINGPHFGWLTVIASDPTYAYVRCRCRCGAIINARIWDLVTERITMCFGCRIKNPHLGIALPERDITRCAHEGCLSGSKPTILCDTAHSYVWGERFCSKQCQEKESARRKWLAFNVFRKVVIGEGAQLAIFDDTPHTFGYLTIQELYDQPGRKRYNRIAVCRCICGATVEVQLFRLIRRQVTGCLSCAPVTSKRCSKCFEDLPISEFGPDKRNWDGLQPSCRKCARTPASEARQRLVPPPDARCARTLCLSGNPVREISLNRNSIVYGEWFCSRECMMKEKDHRKRLIMAITGYWDRV